MSNKKDNKGFSKDEIKGLISLAFAFVFNIAYIVIAVFLSSSETYDSVGLMMSDKAILITLAVSFLAIGMTVFFCRPEKYGSSFMDVLLPPVVLVFILAIGGGIFLEKRDISDVLVVESEKVVQVTTIHKTHVGKSSYQVIEFNNEKYKAEFSTKMIEGQVLKVETLKTKDGKYSRMKACTMLKKCYRLYSNDETFMNLTLINKKS